MQEVLGSNIATQTLCIGHATTGRSCPVKQECALWLAGQKAKELALSMEYDYLPGEKMDEQDRGCLIDWQHHEIEVFFH